MTIDSAEEVAESAAAQTRSFSQAMLISAVLVSCTVLGLAATDLVLPAIPSLPGFLGGSVSKAQLVLATFAAGSGIGLLLFGELGARFEHRSLLLVAMLGFSVLSFWAGMVDTMDQLILVRFFQGIMASCGAVVAPGIIRSIFSEQGAIRALGILGSIESLAPAIAPTVGLCLLAVSGWSASFFVTASLGLLLCFSIVLIWRLLPASALKKASDRAIEPATSNYKKLLLRTGYMKYSLSQALALGGLLVFVFAAPVVIIDMGGTLTDFIIMQICGIATFIIAANIASKLVARYGADNTIMFGTLLSVFGVFTILIYAFSGGSDPRMVWLLFVPLNMGLGFRGPPSFYQALVASDGDDARASALLILFVMIVTAGGTAAIAPWITQGLPLISSAVTFFTLLSLIVFWGLGFNPQSPSHLEKEK